MSYRVLGLDPEPFRQLYCLSDRELAARGARRYRVDSKPGFPDRVELRDLKPGETAILLNYLHQPAANPYRSRHAIFVGEGADEAAEVTDQMPPMLLARPLSLRAFDADDMMIDADVATPASAEWLVRRLLAETATAYIHAHSATRGCYLARIERT